jgi:hypothetical protein
VQKLLHEKYIEVARFGEYRILKARDYVDCAKGAKVDPE